LSHPVCIVNLFRSILPVVPTECDVLIVCRQHNDKDWEFKEQRAKVWEKYCGGEKIVSPPWFQHCGGECPHRSDASECVAPPPIIPRQLPLTLAHNFTKYWPIFKILSLLDSVGNFQYSHIQIPHHTLNVSLHYFVKYLYSKNLHC